MNPLQKKLIITPYADCQSTNAMLPICSLEKILAEKLRSLLTRTEPRDLFDVHYIFTNQMADVERIAFYMGPKFDAKGFKVSELRTILARRKSTFDQLWKLRLKGQMAEIPPLETVIRETNRFIQQYF